MSGAQSVHVKSGRPSVPLQEDKIPKAYGDGTAGWLDMRSKLLRVLSSSDFYVCVCSFLDWGWAISFRQLGARRVFCLGLSEGATRLLDEVKKVVPGIEGCTRVPER